MIPLFPEFKHLELSDRREYESYTAWMAPHSDFNFVSVWAWTAEGAKNISVLNDNLVILYGGFVPGEYFLSFAGRNRADETARALIEFFKGNYGMDYLYNVPEEVVSLMKDTALVKKVNENNCDYLLKVADYAEADRLTRKSGWTGQLCRMFVKLYPGFYVRTSRLGDFDKDELISLFRRWAVNKKVNLDSHTEFKAFMRFILPENENIYITGIYADNALIGFQTLEILDDVYAMCDFMKCDTGFKGVYQATMWKACEFLRQKGIGILNVQTDMGSAGLRKSKNNYTSSSMLKRFIVRLKD
jgi:hypothetical protein